ncbi:protein BRE4 [Physcia stellaris]|nr:protein BRE4 [Physcia stellaris]
MDPLSAFSLTCNIIQVVDFGSKALVMCKELYDHGILSEYQDLEETAKHLFNLQRSLGLPGGNTPSSLGSAQILPQQDDLLMKVAKQCSETAEQLVKKLREFSVAGPHHKKRQAISKAFKAIWRGGDIKQLQRQLDAHQKALDTRILIDLRHRQDLTSLQQRQDFQTIDLKVQTLISSLAQGPKSFEELRALIRDEHGKTQKLIKDEHVQTREHVTKSFQERDHVQEVKEFRTQFHRSLWFDELYSREETIRYAHPQTFRWILDKSAKNMGPWDNFVEWLEFGQGTYWISGKPGSGKSTLMGFICQNHCTIESLRIWSTNKDILVLKFYFWSGGTSLEKSINGLLRSLLWQILEHVPNLHVSNLQLTSGSSLTAEPIASWTERRLRTMFTNIIPQVVATHRVCIFLDGLDEFDGDHDELVSFIRETLWSTEIKMCLSSRLYRAFDQAFGSSTKLRLQDLTRNDIRKFVVNKFQDREVLQILPTAAEASDWLEWTKNNILDRAEGVFLWVDLAVKDQIRGLKNGDSLQQLEESLECLPDEIEDIYARMLSQIKKPHRKEASIFLQIALNGRDRSLLSHVLAMQPDLDGILSAPGGMLEDRLITSHHTVANRIATTCAGLLEVNVKYAKASRELHTHMYDEESCYSPDRDEPYSGSHREESGSDCNGGEPQPDSIGEDADSADKHLYANSENEISYREEILAGPGGLDICLQSQVTFVHRTAVDFMTDQKQGGAFLNVNTPINFDPKTFHVKNLLAQVKLLGVSQSREFKVDYAIDDIMLRISYIECETGVAQTKLCSLTDDIMSRIDRDHTGHEDSHWSARWGPKEFRQQKEDVISSISSKSSQSRFEGLLDEYDLSEADSDVVIEILRKRYSNPPRRDLMEDLCEDIDDKVLQKLLRLFATSERLIPTW